MSRSRFNIGLRSGLLDAKHVQAMGQALWLFGWYVDRQTDTAGTVLGGRTIIWAEVKLGVNDRTLRRWQRILEGANAKKRKYVAVKLDPGLGFTVRILRPKKTPLPPPPKP